jgi:hypothetical protein
MPIGEYGSMEIEGKSTEFPGIQGASGDFALHTILDNHDC